MLGASEPITTWSSLESDAPPALPASTTPLTTEAPLMQLSPQPAPPDAAARRRAGVAIVLAGAGLSLGWLLAGGWGAGAGFVLVGAARNGWRAKELWSGQQAGDRDEAAKSATMAAIGTAVGGYLAYRAYQARQGITAEE